METLLTINFIIAAIFFVCYTYQFAYIPVPWFKKPHEHAVMVGDRDMDMLGAHENGITAVGAVYGYGGREELASSGADYIINTPAELLKIVL